MANITLEGTDEPITTTQACRLVCGASVEEFPDQSFIDIEATEDLELDLNDWLSDASLSYITIVGQGTASSPTAQQRQDYLNLKKYSKYYIGALLAKTAGLAFAEQLSDGQNMFKRAKLDVDEMVDRLIGKAEEAKQALLDAHGYTREAIEPLSGVGNIFDPVTGETG